MKTMVRLTQMRTRSKNRRRTLKSRGLCINGEQHGEAIIGGKCGWCGDVHRRGIAAVEANPIYDRPISVYRRVQKRRRAA